MQNSPLEKGISSDTALGGRVKVLQPRKGYRFSVDAILLARFASSRKVENCADLGSGSGVVGLCLLALGSTQKLLGVDIQEKFVDLAKSAALLNGFDARAAFVVGDVRNMGPDCKGASMDLVVSNPPYRPTQGLRHSPDETVAIARNEVCGSLEDFVAAASYLLKKEGTFCAVYPASRCHILLATALAKGLNPVRVRFVHPRCGEAASLVLLEAVKGGRGSLVVEPPLMLHDGKLSARKYSDEAEALLGA